MGLTLRKAKQHALSRAAAERARIRLARASYQDFLRYTWPDEYHMNWHHEIIADTCDEVLSGKERFVIFEAPPRSNKSEIISRGLPAYWLGQRPDDHIIAASYSAELAYDMSRDVQRLMTSMKYSRVFPDTRLALDTRHRRREDITTVGQFTVMGKKGRYRAAGAGGTILGRGAHLFLIDDPFKGRQAAESAVVRETLKAWFRGDVFSRLEPGGRIILMHQRLHDDDLAGWAQREWPGLWKVVTLPAIMDEASEAKRHPRDHRKHGEPLDPTRYGLTELEQIRKVSGTYGWESLYQQRPQPPTGGILSMRWFRRYKLEDPTRPNLITHDDKQYDIHSGYRFITCDLANSRRTAADYTVFCVWSMDRTTDKLYLLDVSRGQWSSPDSLARLESLAKRWRVNTIHIEKAGQQGHYLDWAKERLERFHIRELEANKDKISRAYDAAPYIEQGLVYLPDDNEWLGALESEILAFSPNAAHDDQVDALVYGVLVAKDNAGDAGPVRVSRRNR